AMNNAMLIGEAFVSGGGQEETIVNPRTGETIASVPEATGSQIDEAVKQARLRFSQWSRTTPAERSGLLLAIADRIESEAGGFAALEALNCGKPINAVTQDEL